MNLAAIAQTELRYLLTSTESAITSTDETFAIDYELDHSQFRAALTRLVA